MNLDKWEKTYRWQEHGHPYWPKEFKFLWPTADSSLFGDIPTLTDLDEHVLPMVPDTERKVAIQAGGAMGMWAKRLAQVFERVYTFEPTPQSFHCLASNCPEENIVKIQAALGQKPQLVRMEFPEHPSNYGGFRCFNDGFVPTIRIDDLGLDRLDLLMLDLEGYELFALQGGIETIKRCSPIIVMEDKGCSRAYGYERGRVEKYLARQAGYRTKKRFHGGRDVICAKVRV